MISRIMPVSFKGNTDTNVAETTETQQVVTAPVAQTEPQVQVDTFTNTTPKKSGNGSLLTGILGLMEMVNTLLSMSTKK